jgi:hypothetical protein
LGTTCKYLYVRGFRVIISETLRKKLLDELDEKSKEYKLLQELPDSTLTPKAYAYNICRVKRNSDYKWNLDYPSNKKMEEIKKMIKNIAKWGSFDAWQANEQIKPKKDKRLPERKIERNLWWANEIAKQCGYQDAFELHNGDLRFGFFLAHHIKPQDNIYYYLFYRRIMASYQCHLVSDGNYYDFGHHFEIQFPHFLKYWYDKYWIVKAFPVDKNSSDCPACLMGICTGIHMQSNKKQKC